MPTYTTTNATTNTTTYYSVLSNSSTQYTYYRLYDLYCRNGTGGGSQTLANSPYVIDDWRLWNTSTATTSNTYQYCTSNDIWTAWTTVDNHGQTFLSNQVVVPLREPTAEELAEQKAREDKRARAKVKAKSLLDSMLTPEQRQYVERHGYIPVVGSRGRRYHIRTHGSASGNVALVDDKGAVLARFCAHPTATHDGKVIPTEDQFLAQLLHLQDDEDDFLRRANVNEGQRPALLVA